MPTLLTPLSAKGPEVSRFIAGYWRLNQWQKTSEELLSFVLACLDLGISTVDHAMVYRSEAAFGRALALQPGLRHQLQIISKFGIRPQGFGDLGARHINHYDNSKTALIQSVDASLRDLNTDYLDILLVHRPDYLLDATELAEAMVNLHQAGKVRHLGVSNFNIHQFERLQAAVSQHLPCGLVTNQIECSPLQMQALEDGTLEQASRHGYRPMLWSCLGGGALFKPESERHERIRSALQQVAAELAVDSLATVVYAWLLALPCQPLPLLGTVDIERIQAALKAVSVPLNREQWYRIWQASTGHSVP